MDESKTIQKTLITKTIKDLDYKIFSLLKNELEDRLDISIKDIQELIYYGDRMKIFTIKTKDNYDQWEFIFDDVRILSILMDHNTTTDFDDGKTSIITTLKYCTWR